MHSEKPTAQLTTDKSSFPNSDDALISCTGSGGYPRYYIITLWKEGNVLKNTTGPMLEFSTTDIPNGLSKYGTYRCTVHNTLAEDSTSIALSNEGTNVVIIILRWLLFLYFFIATISVVFSSGNCKNWVRFFCHLYND